MNKEKTAALPTTLRQKNQFAILNTFRGGEALSANDVSDFTGISRATVMKAISRFIENGFLESAGKGESTQIGGKRPELFRFCMERYILCIGLSGKEMEVALYNLKNIRVAKETVDYDMKESVNEFFDKVQETADRILSSVEKGRELLYGVTLCIGGFLDVESGILQYSVLTPEWGYNIPVRDLLKERFPDAEIVVDNVARMSACAEVLDNPLYENKRVAVIYTDVGVSACYIDKGRVLHGKNSMIGEIGMMILSLLDESPYTKDNNSCFSDLISEKNILRKVYSQKGKFEKSSLSKADSELKLLDIFEEADKGDGYAREIVRDLAWIFSAALQNLVVNFDPEVVIMQGTFSKAGKWFDDCLQEGMACFPRNTVSISFEVKYDRRPVVSLQMYGATKSMVQKFFLSAKLL